MPDNRGRLSSEEKAQAVGWLRTSAMANLSCSACGLNDWGITEHVVQVPVFAGGTVLIGGPTYPVIALVCNNCGNFRFHSAIRTGILQADEDQKSAE